MREDDEEEKKQSHRLKREKMRGKIEEVRWYLNSSTAYAPKKKYKLIFITRAASTISPLLLLTLT